MMRRGVLALAMAAALVSGAPALAQFQAEEGIDLEGVFGHAIASATGVTGDTMALDLLVEADPDAAVVAHLIEPGGAQQTLPMPPRVEGAFGIRIEVRKIDYVVVFEAVEGSLASQSQPLRLTEMGVDPSILGRLPGTATTPEEISDSTRQWGWAGLALAAAALTLLAFWALPDRRRRARAAAAADTLGTPERPSESQTEEAVGPSEVVEDQP